ncbi:lytic transglycosylase domain-containing protein [Thiohalocapsa marina]|nr:lytic transglycosylase domain-containing protein [Thiohalocapsa marina]
MPHRPFHPDPPVDSVDALAAPLRIRPLLAACGLIALACGQAAMAATDTEAHRLLDAGRRFEHGVGAPQDIDRALRLYCRAGDLGLAEASYHLGWLYSSGRVGTVDEVLGAAWYKAAQAARHPQAETQLRQLGALDAPLDQPPECVLKAALRERRLPATATQPGAHAPPMADIAPLAAREIGHADIVSLVRYLAPQYRLPPELVLAVIAAESNFNPDAHSPKDARGLMQLIPETAARFGVSNPWNPIDNLRGGMAYLRWLLDHFNGDLELALAGYNAGENAVIRHGGIPPYPETQAYVRQIRQRLGRQSTGPVSVIRGQHMDGQGDGG